LERDRKTILKAPREGGAIEMTVLKLCGTTSAGDAQLAREADFCGMLVGVDWSERSLTLERARIVAKASSVKNVILLCNPTAAFAQEVAYALRPHALQLHCRERPALVSELKELLPCEIWKTVHLPPLDGQAEPEAYAEAGADALLVDSVDVSEGFQRLGGTGKVGDWAAVAALKKKMDIPLFLAGGIGPENVADAVRSVRPHGIDLCSGVEMRRGQRDPEKVKGLVRSFRGAVAEFSEMPGQEEK